MRYQTDAIDTLSQQHAKSMNSDDYFLSVYAACNDSSKLAINQKLRSLIDTTIKEQFEDINTTTLRNDLVTYIQKEISSIDDLPRGIAIFTKIDTSNGTSFDSMELIQLYKEPSDETYIGKTFKLDQLNRSDAMQHYALTLNIKQEYCDIFQTIGNDFSKILRIENEYTNDNEKEYMQRFSPTRSDQITHGAGSDKLQRSELKKSQHFLNQITDTLKQLDNNNVYDYLVIFYSQPFSELIVDFVNDLKLSFAAMNISFIDKNIKDKKELHKQTRGLINSLHITHNHDTLRDSRENHQLHAYGWNDVTSASRHGQIDTLFTSPDLEKSGYVVNQNLLYSYPVKNSKKVKNITPWLINSTLQTGGEVVYIKDNEVLPEDTIEAKLRYQI